MDLRLLWEHKGSCCSSPGSLNMFIHHFLVIQLYWRQQNLSWKVWYGITTKFNISFLFCKELRIMLSTPGYPSSACFLHFPLNPDQVFTTANLCWHKNTQFAFQFTTLLQKSSYSHDSFKANCRAQGRQNGISDGTSEINELLKGWDQ